MKEDKLNLIKEDVYKCSKCGLCQSVCPVYIATKNEMYLPRGRYIVLNNFFINKKKLSSEFIKNLDICLNCNECKNFCPSGIDSREIFTELKNIYNYKYSFLSFSSVYFLYLYIQGIKRLFTGKDLYKIKVKRRKVYAKLQDCGNVAYFEGCFNKYINPSDKNASLNLIEKLGYKAAKTISLCCGQPYLSSGDLDSFRKNADKIIQSLPVDIKYVVCSCDSCYYALKKVLENSSFAGKLIRIDDLLRLHNCIISINSDALYHKTLGRNNECYLPKEIRQINPKNCSLMENFFLLKYKEMTKMLINKVFYKKEQIDNKIIITTCLLSNWGLKTGIKYIKSNAKVLSYSEYAELYSEILK